MSALRLYLTATDGTLPSTAKGTWDADPANYCKVLAASKDGSLSYAGFNVTDVTADWDTLGMVAVSGALAEAINISGTVSGCIGFRGASGLSGYPHYHIWVRAGSSGDTVRGTLLTDLIDSDNELGTTAYGRAFSDTGGDVEAQAGDTIVVEIGIRSSASSQPLTPRVYFGGTDETDLSEGAAAGTYSGWVEINYTTPDPPTLAIPLLNQLLLGGD